MPRVRIRRKNFLLILTSYFPIVFLLILTSYFININDPGQARQDHFILIKE